MKNKIFILILFLLLSYVCYSDESSNVSTEETKLILQFLESNLVSMATFIIVLVFLLILMLRGGDKVFPRLKKAKIGPNGLEVEREIINNDGEERRDCTNRGRRSTDVCSIHCNIADVIEANTKVLEELKNVDKKLIEHDDEQWRDLLQIKFCMESMPKSTRMIAGLTLLWWGVNGDFKIKVNKFIETYKEVYDDVVDARPELRLGNYAKGREPKELK